MNFTGLMVLDVAAPLPYRPFDADEAGECERAVLRECSELSHTWSINEQDRASALLRDILRYRDDRGEVGILLRGASLPMLQAALGVVCGIEGRGGSRVFPELRWCNFPAGVVCYRSGLSAPLNTKQFEPHREYLEQLWRRPVSIEVGTVVGASPGSIVVRPGTGPAIGFRAPLSLPAVIPLVRDDNG